MSQKTEGAISQQLKEHSSPVGSPHADSVFCPTNSVPEAAASDPYLESIAKTGAPLDFTPSLQYFSSFSSPSSALEVKTFFVPLARESAYLDSGGLHYPTPLPDQGILGQHQLELKPCPGWAAFATCENGHHFAKELLCGKEWCSVCGSEWSASHQRRFARWLPKANQLNKCGYLVITFPPRVRASLRNKKELSRIRSLIVHYLKRHEINRGLLRWHWFGSHGSQFHPHLNLLLDFGRFTKKFLKQLRLFIASLVGVPDLVQHYSYTDKIPIMIHHLKYITRATFTNLEWDPVLAEILKNFRNQTSFGIWKTPTVWGKHQNKMDFEHIIDLEHGKCPVCRTEGKEVSLKWSSKPLKIVHLRALTHAGLTLDLGAGYYQVLTNTVKSLSP